MKHTYKLLVLSGIILGVSGCSFLTGETGYFRDKSSDYVDESVTPNLVIPDNLKPVQSVDYMAIPAIGTDTQVSRDTDTPRADRRVVREDGVTYEISTRNNRPVLIINRPTHMVWPFLGMFWEAKGVPVVRMDASQGITVTEWIQLGEASQPGFMRRLIGNVIDLENANSSQEKFRLILRPGRTATSSEVTLEHVRRRDGSDLSVPVNWVDERNTSPALEGILLNEVLISLVQSRGQPVVGNSGNIDTDQTSLHQDGNGNPLLRINSGFAHSWQAVESALTNMGITIIDRNRSLGLIYIDVDGEQITQPDESSGWFGGWFGGDNEETTEELNLSSEYSVRVQSSGDATNVTLEKDLNTLPPANISQQFLEHLRESF